MTASWVTTAEQVVGVGSTERGLQSIAEQLEVDLATARRLVASARAALPEVTRRALAEPVDTSDLGLGTLPPERRRAMIEVELDIFSGRPNPTWLLDNANGAHLLDLIASSNRAETGHIANNLGYRGFVIRDGQERVVRVQHGTIEIEQGTERSYRIDRDRGLERWLLSTAGSALDASVRAVVASALAD